METEQTVETEQKGWPAWTRPLFSEILKQDQWYVENSDTEDVEQREKEEDDFVDEEAEDPKCPTICFTATEKAKWRREWRSALVVKGLGRRVAYVPLAKRLNYLWGRHGELQISDMENGCYLVRFRNQKDYDIATMGGPWLLGDTYLTVHRWFKGFNPWKSTVTSTMVWVQLPELPIEFINKEAVLCIAEAIGRPIRVDRATELGARGKYGRVCVEVDLTRPLLSQYKIEGITYLIQYEGLEKVCTNCGKYGKSTVDCQCLERMNESSDEGGEGVREASTDPTKGRTYGEWMVVKKKEWKSGRREGTVSRNIQTTDKTNRFHALHEVPSDVNINDEMGEVTDRENGMEKMTKRGEELLTKVTQGGKENIGDKQVEGGSKEEEGAKTQKESSGMKKSNKEEQQRGEGRTMNPTGEVSQNVVGGRKELGKSRETSGKIVNSGKSPGVVAGGKKNVTGPKMSTNAEGAGNRSPSVPK
ncbi:unnamed protein product [Linum tenue]|uniref:DUF4283 domain-containing protein n=2 Tax=Linum tenue TaxID=586396 RepID=A0AAV0L2M1_9ROSI|nr:unnamed protein product [Linum tenue]